MTEEDLTEKVVIDMQLPLCEITEDFVQELSLLEPFGKGNTKPVFARRKLLFRRGRVIGKHQNVLKLEVEDADHTTMDAIFLVIWRPSFPVCHRSTDRMQKTIFYMEEEIRF